MYDVCVHCVGANFAHPGFFGQAPYQLQVVPMPTLVFIVIGQWFCQIKDNQVTAVCLKLDAAALDLAS